ncbi:MAG: hypothetical protein OEM00_12955 [Burkholderiaceae bacterium]|nr:hypothetical protein [Burkholderiaceae bacterium]
MTSATGGLRSSLTSLVPWRLRSLNNLVVASPNALFAGVKHTPPQPVDGTSPIEVHALVCSRDVNMMLTSAKSLMRYCPPVALVIHDDGSLTCDDCAQFQLHLPGVRVLARSEADEAMRAVLPQEIFDKRQKHIFLIKLFDFNHFNCGTHTLMLDSDIVFLRKPDEIVQWMHDESPPPFYNKDCCPSYRASRVPDGLELPLYLNAGFMGFCGRFETSEIIRCGFELNYWLEDQTLYAALLAGRGARPLDTERYRIYVGEPITERTSMVHFISPKRFKRLLYPRLARRIYRELRRAS